MEDNFTSEEEILEYIQDLEDVIDSMFDTINSISRTYRNGTYIYSEEQLNSLERDYYFLIREDEILEEKVRNSDDVTMSVINYLVNYNNLRKDLYFEYRNFLYELRNNKK